MPLPPAPLDLHALAFDRRAWTPGTARAWAREHGYRAPACTLTPHEILLVQAPASSFVQASFVRAALDEGVIGVYGRRKQVPSPVEPGPKAVLQEAKRDIVQAVSTARKKVGSLVSKKSKRPRKSKK